MSICKLLRRRGSRYSDTTAPTITTATVEDANPNKLVVVFSEVVTITNTTGLTITGAATPTLSAPTGSGTDTITFTLSAALTNGQSVTLNVASSNTIKDAANNSLAATTPAITNNVAAFIYEAETTSYMNAVAIPNDNTVYYATTPQEITGAALWTSVDTFVAALKTNSILSKMKAIYPFIGGTAATHKWNLINPQDTDAAYRLVFFGSLIHSKTGMQGNGSNTYANTKAVHNAIFTLGSESFGIYSRTDVSDSQNTDCDMGARDTIGSYFFSNYTGLGILSRSQSNTSSTNAFTDNKTLGMHLENRLTSTSYRVRKRDQVLAININSSNLINIEMIIGARGTPTVPDAPSSKEFSFSFMGEGLTITEENNLVIAINQLQTDLKRNV